MYNRKEDQFKVDVSGGTKEERDKLVHAIGHSLLDGGFTNVSPSATGNVTFVQGLSWADVYKELKTGILDKKITIVSKDDTSDKVAAGFYSSRATLTLRDQLHKVNTVLKTTGKEEELTKETDIVLYGFDLDSHDGANMV